VSHGLSRKDIATRLNLTAENLRQRYHRALEAVKKCLGLKSPCPANGGA
jgi:DNA-directed RNA polymerase specialized sigma24 family protein